MFTYPPPHSTQLFISVHFNLIRKQTNQSSSATSCSQAIRLENKLDTTLTACPAVCCPSHQTFQIPAKLNLFPRVILLYSQWYAFSHAFAYAAWCPCVVCVEFGASVALVVRRDACAMSSSVKWSRQQLCRAFYTDIHIHTGCKKYCMRAMMLPSPIFEWGMKCCVFWERLTLLTR